MFGPNPISDLIEGIVAFLPNIFVAVVILVIASALAKVVTDLLTATLGAVSGGQWIARIAGLAILVIGVFAALNQLQVAPEIVNGLYYAHLGDHRRFGRRRDRRRRHPNDASLLGAGQHEP